MEPQNLSKVTEFQLLGFQNLLGWQALLFAIFLCFYLLTITGNMVIIIVVSEDPRLRSPMYTFLQHLSFLEIWYTSTTVPLLLANLASWGHTLSFPACMAQLYFFVFFGATECFLLAAMAYDRYLAICSPLHYSVLMSPDNCIALVTVSWVTGVGTCFLPSLMISKLDFCGPNRINHFFCDLPPLMQLSCSSVYVTEMAIFVLSIAVLCICFLLTLMSYVFIVSSILRIPSTSGRMKTFSTCGSHLAVVTIYYGTMISMYVRPNAHLSPEINKVISVFYTVVTPLLNPVIYSLRNKDFKEAVRKITRMKCGIYRAKGGGLVVGRVTVDWGMTATFTDRIFKNKGCTSGTCSELVLSATLGDQRKFSFENHCCTSNECNKDDIKLSSSSSLNGVECTACYSEKAQSCSSVTTLKCTGKETKCIEVTGTSSIDPSARDTHFFAVSTLLPCPLLLWCPFPHGVHDFFPNSQVQHSGAILLRPGISQSQTTEAMREAQQKMGSKYWNYSTTGFILTSLFNNSQTHLFLFSMVVLIYILAMAGNTAMVLLIWMDTRLHTPMYFLLSQLSFLDVFFTSVTVPKMIVGFLFGWTSISFGGCGAQMFFFMFLGAAECLLLALMAYDRYVAICNPLRYPVLMSRRVCLLMVVASWLGGSLNASIQTSLTLQFPYCGSRKISHFFCEVPSLLMLACADTEAYEQVLFVTGVVVLLVPITFITTSYALILAAVLRMRSVEGRQKALATCSSHLTVVNLFYGHLVYTYMLPASYHSPGQDDVVSVFYTVLTPMLNPVIYSLRNKEVTGAMKKAMGSQEQGVTIVQATYREPLRSLGDLHQNTHRLLPLGSQQPLVSELHRAHAVKHSMGPQASHPKKQMLLNHVTKGGVASLQSGSSPEKPDTLFLELLCQFAAQGPCQHL
ncbi:olfactory receptor 323 [Cricetulus griseus]